MESNRTADAALFQAEYKKLWEEKKIKSPSGFRPVGMPEEDMQYFLNWAYFVYAQYCNNYTLVIPGGYIPSVSTASLEELRLYGRGKQPVQKYRDQIDVSNVTGPDNKKVGVVNISWRTTQVYQKMREIIIDRLLSVEYEPGVVAVDKPSLRKKQLAYARDLVAVDPRTKQALQAIGKTPTNVDESVLNMDKTDIEVLNQLGGYKTVAEMAFQEASLACLQLSDYDPVIRRQMLEDLVDAGHMAAAIRYDAPSGIQQVEYVDLKGLIVPRSEYDDCRDMHFGGYLKTRSIAWLRQYTNLTEDQLKEVAVKYNNTGMNGAFGVDMNGFSSYGRSNYDQNFSGFKPYDQFQTQVMTLYFFGSEVERYVMGQRPEGNMIFTKVSEDSALLRSDRQRDKTLHDNIVQYVYKVNWIVGTNMIFDYGVNDVVPRDGSPGDMRAKLPIVVYRTNKGSITDACIGAIDDLQLALFRRRHVLAKMPTPPNVMVDTALIQDSLQLGNLNLSAQDVGELYSALGYYYYASRSEYGLPGEASNRPPISPMPDTTSGFLTTLGGEIINSIQMLREISGVNELVDGTGNAKDVLNKVAAGYEAASNRSISGLYTAQESVYKMLVKLIVKGYQCLLAYKDIELTYLPVNFDVVRVVNLYKDYGVHEMDVTVVPGVDGTSRQLLYQALTSNRDSQRIDEATYFQVVTMIQQGAIRRAQFVMAKAVAEQEARKQQHEISVIREQSAAQAEQAKQTEAAKRETLKLESQLKIEQIIAQGEQARETERVKLGQNIAQQAISQVVGNETMPAEMPV